ncbi:hypothetical protein BDN72DRAFT_126571 [Pluteus cervinus]|uniref:Uncharacterized protein n=1 Tax=Pluteus cervinus TaxID=181527 RepID=A0ACD3AMK2_9AGAR|nr:hypothetical protein BDN72DRAFT_126571 [Pluteus cervinus]
MITATDLPFELVQEILVISAQTSLKQAAILARVSHHIYDLIKPILLCTCVYWDEDRSWPGEFDSKRIQSNGKYVRNLLWGNDRSNWNLLTILESCPNLTNIAIWLDASDNDLLLFQEPLSRLRPYRLSIDFSDLFGGLFQANHAQLPMFVHLTHLEMASKCGDWESIEGITYLPSLTHLSLPGEADLTATSVIRDALERCKYLSILVLFVSLEAKWISLGEVAMEEPLPSEIQDLSDPRLVAIRCAYLREWEVGCSGGRDMWTLAEEIIEKRTQKL